MEIKFIKIPTSEKTRKYRCSYKMITWEVESRRSKTGKIEWIVRDSFGLADKDIAFKTRMEAKEYLKRKSEKLYKG